MESDEKDSYQYKHCNGFQIPTPSQDPINELSSGEASQGIKVSRPQTLFPINGDVAGDRLQAVNSQEFGTQEAAVDSLIEGAEGLQDNITMGESSEKSVEEINREIPPARENDSLSSQAVGGARPKVRLNNVAVGEKSKTEGRTNYGVATQSCDNDLLCPGLLPVTGSPLICDKMMSFDLPNLPQMGPRGVSLRPLNSLVPGMPVLEHRTSRANSDTEDVVESEVSDMCEEDCYVYTYKGGTDYLAADLPNSFFRLDSGSDGESLPGVAGAGQSNLSTGVAAFIQDQMLNARPFSPDQDEPLELDFDPGSGSDSSDSEDSGQGAEGTDMEGEEPEGAVGADNEEFHAPDLSPLVPNATPARTTPSVSNASVSRATVSNTPVPRVSSPDSDGLGHVTPSPGPDASPVHSNNNDVADDISPRERSTSGDNEKSKSSSTCQTCQEDTISRPRQQSPPLVSPPQPPQLPQLLHLPQNPPSPRAPPPMAIRSVPLMSPVEPGAAVSIPRSRSLNSTLGGCLILEEGQVPGPDVASTDAAVNLSVCGARLLQREALLFGERQEREFASALGSLSLDEEVDERRVDWVPRTMIWGEREACRRLVNQIGVSACGATALVNVLMALDVPHNVEHVQEAVQTKQRRQTSPIPDYLLSRSLAGCNHQDLIDGMQSVSGGTVVGRFFPMHKRSVQLSSWLASWISRGCVPVATLNVQKAILRPGQVIADAWHHQMIWGVAGRGVYLSNPLEVVSDQLLTPQLSSPSELLIRRADVVSRWSPDTDLGDFTTISDERWATYNVLGQVVNLLREDRSSKRGQLSRALTSHIRIPASYKSGITFFCLSENLVTAKKLLEADNLPFDNSGAPSLLGYDEC